MTTSDESSPRLPRASVDRVQALLAQAGPARRVVLGLVGAPGAGKSTLATALQSAFADVSVVLPMDGFHLANSELERLGRAGRKGAPDTFDAAGYVALLQRLRDAGHVAETIYAPEFRREIEEAVAGAIAIEPRHRLVITEGNYLLVDQGAWRGASALLDECWYVDVDERLRNERLISRHQAFGRSAQEAVQWAAQTDAPNAVLVASTRVRADHVFRWSDA
ncbi:MAG: nucleoside/nucleotide kinase family protein [Proteobacteria bacterium]|nr:nucleoside/nucleotide kinase family protein [Pseudomonadota bacterium]